MGCGVVDREGVLVARGVRAVRVGVVVSVEVAVARRVAVRVTVGAGRVLVAVTGAGVATITTVIGARVSVEGALAGGAAIRVAGPRAAPRNKSAPATRTRASTASKA